ncbi:MAG TPA: serine hydroxymethyltransferase [Planctomycetota bacterium]|nr:serine hydroxymethyltransferase [Planctomycetota bacterium]
MNAEPLSFSDPEIFQAIYRDTLRQQDHLVLIASENYVSEAALEAQGSVLTNKYAEGYPAKRYYGGCEWVDVCERLAIERAKTIFGAEHANVQPHCGSSANMAVYLAVLKPGDTIMGMSLAHGGHLTHGYKMNFSGVFYKFCSYGVSRETERIDYDEVARLAREHKPSLIVAGCSAYPREIDFAKFAEIARDVGAYLMSDIAHIAGLIAGGVHPDATGPSDFVTGTTHKTMRGPRGGFILSKAKYADAIDQAVFPGIQGGPLMHVIAAKAVSFREALHPHFRAYQRQIVSNAQTLAEGMMKLGYRITSGGTDNHLLLVDLGPKGITGAVAERVLGTAGITCNKNLIPFDKRRPKDTSGIRLGTPAVTTRGLKQPEMTLLAQCIHKVLSAPDDADVQSAVMAQVGELCKTFPIYRNVVARHQQMMAV